MSTHLWRTGLLVVPLLLAGCASADAAPGAAAAAPPSSSPSAVDQAPPSGTAAMVCGADVVGDVSRALALSMPPVTDSTWADQLFTCDYSLPMGPLVLSVKESPDAAAAAEYFDGRQAELTGAAAALGLGERAFSTPTGTVVVVKDAMTLTVDATGLPEEFGANGQRRSAFAYEVASIVLGCWTGHE
ncbi:hypothetical protein [Modestobacter excelsi]|uniref:hypothetical protein n=1 Tax=Modestobacter excelsi TaxID=2213161 RepID=UPI00110CEDB1|nr:hypothetical protein [Modestobacter excelsi]